MRYAFFVVLALALVGCTQQRSGFRFAQGAVACDHAAASEAGAEILRAGGNAVDAAVGASLALSVVRPHSCGLGGGGFMLVRLTDDPRTRTVGDPVTIAFDYRERAPGAVGPDHFETLPEDASRFSGHAVAVPGTVAGLLAAHRRFGTLPLVDVARPAIRLAQVGYDPGFNGEEAIAILRETIEGRDDDGARWARRTYTQRATSSVVNPRQARLIEAIARDGRDAFYRGSVARHIVDAVREAGGVMTLEDLASYEPTITEAIARDITLGERSYTVVVMPPPSSGGVATLQIFALLERYHAQMMGHVGYGPLTGVGPEDPTYAHALVECMKHAFADRARHMGDSAFVEVPLEDMLDDHRLERAATRLNPERTMQIDAYGVVAPVTVGVALVDDGGTSHLSVVDRWGNAVACTETINLVFGSRIIVPEIGIVLNNEMDDFLTRRGEDNAFGLTQSERNLPAPGKRPLSSMSPTIVLDRDTGEVVAVAGASGGPRIISATTQALLNALLFGMPAHEAVAHARLHHQWRPDTLALEEGFGAAARAALERSGHTVETYDGPLGVVQLLVRTGGAVEAASDPRKGGRPAGH